jgi:hypothetical protein
LLPKTSIQKKLRFYFFFILVRTTTEFIHFVLIFSMLLFWFYQESSNNKKSSIYIRSQYAMLGPWLLHTCFLLFLASVTANLLQYGWTWFWFINLKTVKNTVDVYTTFFAQWFFKYTIWMVRKIRSSPVFYLHRINWHTHFFLF